MARTPFHVSRRRALKLLCPRCGKDKLFSGWFRMNEKCSGCGLKYEREPGYFLGSTYVNYGWTAGTMSVAYMLLHFAYGFPNEYIVPPLTAYSVLFPLFFFRYARSLWLAFDCFLDHTELGELPADQSDE